MPQSFFTGGTLDDALREVLTELLDNSARIKPSRGAARELAGVLIEIANPRARLSRTASRGRIFSCLGELLWYLAGSDDLEFIRYYIKSYDGNEGDPGHVFGAYGPRLRSWNGIAQFANVATLLRKKRDSRRAVIQIFDRADMMEDKDIPCTCTLQFLLRDNKLHMIAHMRSNDAYVGLPHDVFSFTMLQEILCSTLAVDLGTYKHMVGSLHLYERDVEAATTFMDEGWQPTSSVMPSMPVGDPAKSIDIVLDAEQCLRGGGSLDSSIEADLDPYWMDLIRLLQVYRAFKDKDLASLLTVRGQLTSSMYEPYVQEKYVQTLSSC